MGNGKKSEEGEALKKVKDTGSRKSSVDILERRASQTKLSGGILQKTPSPDTTGSLKTQAKDAKPKTNRASKK